MNEKLCIGSGVRLWIFGFLQYNGSMARKPRVHCPGALYHVMLRGNGGQEIFFSQEDRFRFYLLVQEDIERYGHKVHAFCLMTTHVHLAIQVGEIGLPGSFRISPFDRHAGGTGARAGQDIFFRGATKLSWLTPTPTCWS